MAKHNKKTTHIYISVVEVDTCLRLKSLMTQLHEDITTCEFDIGFIVSFRGAKDLAGIRSCLLKSDKIVLWCDGLASFGASRKWKTADSDSHESETVANLKKRPERENIV